MGLVADKIRVFPFLGKQKQRQQCQAAFRCENKPCRDGIKWMLS